MDGLELVDADAEDISVMAEMTQTLIVDEGGVPSLGVERQLTECLNAGFTGVLFRVAGAIAGYAMYLVTPTSLFLNHFFVAPQHRRNGFGRAAFARLRAQRFPADLPVVLSVMDSNPGGIAFWQALGFRRTSINMELAP